MERYRSARRCLRPTIPPTARADRIESISTCQMVRTPLPLPLNYLQSPTQLSSMPAPIRTTPAPMIELKGIANTSGFVIPSGSDGSTIRGFVINNFGNNGILLAGNYNTITNCYIGTDITGTTAIGNTYSTLDRSNKNRRQLQYRRWNHCD